jgi:hypothetical protein
METRRWRREEVSGDAEELEGMEKIGEVLRAPASAESSLSQQQQLLMLMTMTTRHVHGVDKQTAELDSCLPTK